MRQVYKIVFRNEGEDSDTEIKYGRWDDVQTAWKALHAILGVAGRSITSLTKVEIIPVNKNDGSE